MPWTVSIFCSLPDKWKNHYQLGHWWNNGPMLHTTLAQPHFVGQFTGACIFDISASSFPHSSHKNGSKYCNSLHDDPSLFYCCEGGFCAILFPVLIGMHWVCPIVTIMSDNDCQLASGNENEGHSEEIVVTKPSTLAQLEVVCGKGSKNEKKASKP